MKLGELIKSELKNFLLVIAYIIVAISVYVIWFDSLWHLWYIDVITGVVILAIGVLIGYYYIKGEYNAHHKIKEEKKEEKEENSIVEEKEGE